MKKLGAVTVVTVGLAVLACGGSLMAAEATSPPTHLKLVDDHWTPWDPPAPGPNDYIIKKGDTLWDLAGEWFNDPFLWPQVWDENRYILDSHWIYPGDPLVVPGRPAVVPGGELPLTGESTPTGDGQNLIGDGSDEVEIPPAPLPPPLRAAADPSDLYCSGYIEKQHVPPTVVIAGHDQEMVALGQGHVVFINQGRNQGVRAGDEYSVHRRTDDVIHPATRADVGQFIRRLGKVRVLLVHEDTSTAVIVMSCEDIYDGDGLQPWETIPVPMMSSSPPMNRLDPTPSGGPIGRIIWEKHNLSIFGEGHVIYTDLGRISGVNTGDFITLYRPREGELPRLKLGQAVILTVGPDTSSAKITDSVREAVLGDWVEAVR